MTRRTLASIVAVALIVGLLGVGAYLPVPYVTMSPGPTVDVLSEREGEERVEVAGVRTYPTRGELRLTTVSVTSPGVDLSLAEALGAWFDGTRAVYPRDVIYPPAQSVEEVEQESSAQMVDSQDTAVAVALRELGYDLPLRVDVLEVAEGSPADGALRAGDRIVAVNGTRVRELGQVSALVQDSGTERPTDLVVRRDGASRDLTLRAEPSPDDPDTAVLGVSIGGSYDLPVEVELRIGESIGGPSAGLVFALAVYDTLTPGALAGGADIAGTGTIDDKGAVGPIGGIQQKIVGAADAGAEVFLVPPDNCEAAMGADVREDEIELVRAETMGEAAQALEDYAVDHDAPLPSCEGA